MKASRLTNILLVSFAVVIIMIYGKKLLIPFVLAIIFWFLIKEIRQLLCRIEWIDRNIPRWVLNFLGFAIIFSIIGGVVSILVHNIKTLTELLPQYQHNVKIVADTIQQRYDVDLYSQAKDFLGDYKFSKILSRIFSSLTDVFGDAILILVYTLFLLMEESNFTLKLHKIYSLKNDSEKVFNILRRIDISISRYIAVKTLTSLITGVASYISLLFIGIDTPLFWSFLIFIMNFIPAIGSIIATAFPALFAVFQFGDIAHPVWTLAVVGAIQLFIGNVVDPKLTGNSLNVSPLIVIFGLAFWGSIWGIVGMLLSVPISVMLIIILAQVPATRPFAILLSRKGNVFYNVPKEEIPSELLKNN